MAYMPEELFRATVVGIKAANGVVIATDKRLSYGGLILSKNVKKIFTINEKVAIAFAGLYGDASGLIRILEADLKAYEMLTNTPIAVKTLAKRLSTIMYAYKWFPFFVETLVGGIDIDGKPKLYVLDPLGSTLDEDFAAIGTGATIAFGLLERDYSPNMPIENAENLAISAVRSAISRDVGSGDGIDVISITPNGIRERSIKLRLVEG